MKLLATVLLVFINYLSFAQMEIERIEILNGLNSPIDITHAGDGRMFIVERVGQILIRDENGVLLPTPFLDIDPIVANTAGFSEQGLLGLTFHPDYQNNGYFFVSYIGNDGDSYISRFSVDATNPNLADPDSESIILNVEQPFGNHNGGCLKFGADGYLYLGFGDGGSANDPMELAQNPQTLIGKMLRLDVDNGMPYSIPSDNPFINNNNVLDEIWSLGWRNPWRFSFDRMTGDLWAGDVGQGDFEEIDFEAAGDVGGRNYGWDCYEGTLGFEVGNCDDAEGILTDPVFEYSHAGGNCSVTGGYVYRGQDYPELTGHYFFGDWCTGIMWTLSPDGNGGWEHMEVADFNGSRITSFGEDANGELYYAQQFPGVIYKIAFTACDDFALSLEGVNESCEGVADGMIESTLTNGTEPFNYDWSNDSTTADIVGLSADVYTLVVTDANNCSVERSIVLQTDNNPPSTPAIFSNDATTACEGTSIILELTGDVPNGYTYQWYNGNDLLNNENNDSLIVTSSGSYYVKYVDGPCGDSPSSNWEEVTIIPIPQNPVLSTDGMTSFCEGDSLEINATGIPEDYGIQWYNGNEELVGETATSLTVNTVGQYYVSLTGGDCIEGTSNWIETSINPTPTAPLISEDGFLLSVIDTFDAYQWLQDGIEIDGATLNNVDLSPLVSTTLHIYSVLVTDGNGCSVQSLGVDLVIESVNGIENINDFNIMPNPFTNQLQIQAESNRRLDTQLKVINYLGQIVYVRDWNINGVSNISIDLSQLSAGVYFVMIENEEGIVLRKVVKQ